MRVNLKKINVKEMNNLINHYLFTNFNMTSEMSAEIAHRSRLVTIGKRDLFKVSTLFDSRIVILLEGHAKLIAVDTDGNHEVKELFHTGELFDSSTIATQNECFLQSLSGSCKVAVVGETEFNELISRNPEILVKIDGLRKERIKKLHRRMNYLICRDVEQKMLIFLHELALNDGKVAGEKVVVHNYLTHSDIAEIINMSRQTVTSLLNKLRAEGRIEYSRRELVLLDKDLSENLSAA